mgnify:CR=1 FL=1
MRKRITSLLLVLALCLTLLPTAALAEEASSAAQETQDYTVGEDTAVQGKGENDKAVQTVQALIDALPAAEDISDANADEVSGQLDAIDEAKQALTEEQAARLDLTSITTSAGDGRVFRPEWAERFDTVLVDAPVNTVYSWLARGKKQLQEVLS